MRYPIEIILVSKRRNFLRTVRLPLYVVGAVLVGLTLLAITSLTLFIYTTQNTVTINRTEQKNEYLLTALDSLNSRLNTIHGSFNDYIAQDNRDRIYWQLACIHPDIWSMGIGGTRYQPANEYISHETQNLLDQIYETLDVLKGQSYLKMNSINEIEQKITSNVRFWAHIPSIDPVPGSNFCSGFGYRIDPIKKTVRMHWGVDLSAPRGTPIHTSADGVVSRTEWSTGGYGWVIDVDHGYGFETRYAHCHKILVNTGDIVKRGQIIGTVGSTGRSVAPHCHYEVHVSGIRVNPYHYINNATIVVD
jgi:murein DD-endopeptidase MepM/ murein hydrolase activator NlpD